MSLLRAPVRADRRSRISSLIVGQQTGGRPSGRLSGEERHITGDAGTHISGDAGTHISGDAGTMEGKQA